MSTCQGCAFLEEYVTSNNRLAWRCVLWELWEVDPATREACDFYEESDEARPVTVHGGQGGIR